MVRRRRVSPRSSSTTAYSSRPGRFSAFPEKATSVSPSSRPRRSAYVPWRFWDGRCDWPGRVGVRRDRSRVRPRPARVSGRPRRRGPFGRLRDARHRAAPVGAVAVASGMIRAMDLAARIDELFDAGEPEATPVEEAIRLLDAGEVRVAEPLDDGWVVNEWAKKAILLYFKLRKVEPMDAGAIHYLDKIPLKNDYAERGVRVVPGGVARYGAFLSPGVILMPGFVNIGAWVGPRTMVDTWATVGSCAQIGADVHLAGGVGIGGVLEPPQAQPGVVGGGALLRSRCVVPPGGRDR